MINGNISFKGAPSTYFQATSNKLSTNFLNQSNGVIKKELGKNDFINLMSVQLQYQDPTAPLKNEEMAAQLAQFSSLEQMMNINENFSKAFNIFKNKDNIMPALLIGKEVSVDSSEFSLDKKNSANLEFNLSDKIYSGEISILDKNSSLIRKIPLNKMSEGKQNFHWDGLDQSGLRAKAGNYVFHVTAYDRNMKKVGVEINKKEVISGIEFKNNEPLLIAGNRKIRMDQLKGIFDVKKGMGSLESKGEEKQLKSTESNSSP